jgi:hypothetical protein
LASRQVDKLYAAFNGVDIKEDPRKLYANILQTIGSEEFIRYLGAVGVGAAVIPEGRITQESREFIMDVVLSLQNRLVKFILEDFGTEEFKRRLLDVAGGLRLLTSEARYVDWAHAA